MEAMIRTVAVEDIAGYWRALDSVARERRFIAFLEGPPMASTEAFVRMAIDKKYSQFVAVVDDDVVGWCDIIPIDREGMRHSGQLGMGVIAQFRGMGIGRGLLRATIDDAWAKGIKRIELEVRSSNAQAIGLYEKAGFILEGRKRRALYLDGGWDDKLVMAMLKE
jgi:RimJ/RimL family protein N-acetyltransferase